MFYSGERQHQSLGYATPDVVYHTATGGGAKIVDRFSSVREVTLPAGELGQHQLAAVGQVSILNQVNCVWTIGSTILVLKIKRGLSNSPYFCQ